MRARTFLPRRATAFVACSVCLLSLVACRRADDRTYGTPTPQHATDELWINNTAEPESIDPALCADNVGGEIIWNIFAGLVQLRSDTLEPVPDLAERWERSPDGRTYLFSLRRSAWSDGTPVTAQDFEAAWKRLLDPRTGAKYASFFYVLAGAEAFHRRAIVVTGLPGDSDVEVTRAAIGKALGPLATAAVVKLEPEPAGAVTQALVFLDAKEEGPAAAAALEAQRSQALTTLDGQLILGARIHARLAQATDVGVAALDATGLRVQLARPAPYFLYMLQHYSAMPVPRHVLRRLTAQGLDPAAWTRPENIVTNGAYAIREWQFRHYVLLEASPHYWDAARVRTPRVRLFAVESASTAVSLYKSGALDWTGANTSLPAGMLDELRGFSDFHATPSLSVYWYWLNTRRGALADARVRRALSLAIDRDAIVQHVKRGGEVASADIVPASLQGYTALQSPLSDIPRARALLAEAGYPQGRGLPPLRLLFNTGEGHRLLAEALQQMWAKNLGITIELDNREWKVFLEAVERGDFDIARSGWAADYPDPASFLEVLASASGNNPSGWRSAELDALLDAAGRELEPAARLTLLHKGEAIAAAAQPLVPLYVITRKYLVAPYLRGFVPNVLDRHPFKELALTPTTGDR